jgi:hypothetical protein
LEHCDPPSPWFARVRSFPPEDRPPSSGPTGVDGSDQDLNRLGFWLGAAAQSNNDQGPDDAPPESDLLTAEHLGERVARVTQQFVRGRLLAAKGLLLEAS